LTAPSGLKTPPKARLTFRVGVVGHRPNRLPQDAIRQAQLRAVLGDVLGHVQAAVEAFKLQSPQALFYAPDAPVLRAVSPLAEGTDRIFADEALKRGYGLCCPMPFPQAEFENDFAPEGVAVFRDLLDRAAARGLVRFEMDGRRNSPADEDAEARAYAATGRVVVNQSDLLVVVWDGGQPAGNGGTVHALRDALHYHVPVLWIDALDPQRWQCLRRVEELEALRGPARYAPAEDEHIAPGAQSATLAAILQAIVRDELAVPRDDEPRDRAHKRHEKAKAKPASPSTEVMHYFREHKPWLKLAFAWSLFRDVVAPDGPRPPAPKGSYIDQVRGEWPASAADLRATDAPAPTRVEAWINARLRGHFAWADKLAGHYADTYRSTSVIAYLVSAFAVFIAMFPGAIGLHAVGDLICILLELAAMGTTLVLVCLALISRWHERWMACRMLAELIRQLRLLVPMGGGRPFPHVPDHLAMYGDPARSWMYWQMRAVARDTNLPDATVNRDYLLDCLDHLAGVVGSESAGQWGFHVRTGLRAHRLHHRLERASLVLFILTIVGILIHLGLAWPGLFPHGAGEACDRWLVLVSATAPALGAALAGINNQGEFKRLSKRSEAMADGLSRIARDIVRLRTSGESLRLSGVLQISERLGELMIQEVMDWRIMFTDRPPAAA
jgi:hypothetical protein